jgi:hypothetical protein
MDSVRVGQTAAKTIRKKAHDLRPGDVIRFREDDDRGYAVGQVRVLTHTVEVWGTGPACQYRYDADVIVYDGPPPQPVYSEPKLVLLPEGEAALSLHRMTAGAAGLPNEKSSDQRSLEQQMERAVQAIGDDNAGKILEIASQKDLPGESRMQNILRLDRRFAGKDSNEWATLLGVTPAAVRGYQTWKTLRRVEKAGD